MLRCRGDRLYTGVTNRLPKRFNDHVRGTGAKYTKAFRPESIVFVTPAKHRSHAQQIEWQLKRLSRSEKQDIAAFMGNGYVPAPPATKLSSG